MYDDKSIADHILCIKMLSNLNNEQGFDLDD